MLSNTDDQSSILMMDSAQAEDIIQPIDSIENIQKMIEQSHVILGLIESKQEPVEALEELNVQLNIQSVELNQALQIADNSQLKQEFYQKVFKSIASKMLDGKVLVRSDYLPQILRFFKNVLVNYFPYDIENENLCEVVHQIFNLDASLYTSALSGSSGIRRSSNQDTGDGEPCREQIRLESERAWRSNLKVGDRVDAVKSKPNQQYKVSCWSRGEITKQYADESDSFQIMFDHDYPSTQKILQRYSFEIAPEGTFTDDIDWRYQLKAPEEVDCLDSENTWYRSTILSTRQSQIHANSTMSEVYVGFRVYDEEEGHKLDDEGRKFIGWSSRYDDWKSVTCPTVQRFNTVVKHYQQAGKTSMMYDNVIDDLNDVLYDTKERKIWAVYRQNFFANLRCIADYVNEFGRRGGFEKILEVLKSPSENSKVSLRHLYYIMDFISKTQPLWQRQFACYYIPHVKESFEKGILYTNLAACGPIQLPFLKETLTEIQKSYQKILRRHYTTESYGVIIANLQFSLGFSLLKSEKLEKRIQGLKEVNEQVKNTKFTGRKNLSAREVINKLKEQNIFEIIFGDNYHIQLIQRSTEIIKFFINERELGEKEIDYIWSSTKKDQQTKMEIYKIITDIANMFRNEEIEILVDRFASVSSEQFVDKEIECVYELSKYSYKQATFSSKAANLFWEIATQVRPYKKQIIELAIDKFIELIRNWEREQKLVYIINCVNNIAVNKAPLQSIKILTKLLDQIPNYKTQNLPTLYDISNQLISEYKLLEKLVQNIKDYQTSANDEWTRGIINADNIDNVELLNLPFTHRSHIFIRLNFLKLMLQNAQVQLQKEHLDSLWELLTVQSQISIDSDIFFNWLKQIINDHNKLSPQLTKTFFEENVCREGLSFKNIKKAGFDCICSLFLQINEQDDKLMIIQFSNMGNVQGQNSKLDFRVHVMPTALEGIEVVWKMLQECDKKNLELTAAVIDLVTKVYHNLSSLIEEKIHEIEDQFIFECLRRLKYVIEDPTQSGEEKKQMASITSIMMKSFFEDSEKNGSGGLKTHHAIDKGQFINSIVVQNNITSQKNTPRFIKIDTYSNMTIWEFKKIIAQKFQVSPVKLQINRSDTKKKPILDADNIKLLSDIKISDFELLTAHKKPISYQNRLPLLNSKKQLVPEAQKIFESWFNKFSVDGVMTHENCVDFVIHSTSDQTVNVTDQRVLKLFDEYDKDNDGKLYLDEFLMFYRDRSENKPELVWSNLQSHHFGNDLRPINYKYGYDDDPTEIKEQDLLPRYKLSFNQETFDLLFNLIEKLQEGGQDELWNLINSLRTNPRVYSNLLTLSSIDELASSNISAYKLFYCLQIMESFINEYQIKRETQVTSYLIDQDSSYHSYPLLDTVVNNNNNEQMSSAPISGVAIPLPAQNQSDIYSANIGGNVPQPPAQVPFIGPTAPPQNNTNQDKEKIKTMIQQFKGSVISERLSFNTFTVNDLESYLPADVVNNFDQVKARWLPRFINGGGFKLITQLLTNLNHNCKQQRPQDVLKNKVEKECLTQILKIIKVLLMSAFCGNASSQELATQLQRKMSSKTEQVFIDEEKIEEVKLIEISSPTKSLVQQEQENTAKEYEPLIDAFRGELGYDILQALDFKQFQQQILSVIQIVLRKQQSLGVDDRVIIEQALSLWICCVIYNADLMNYIYGEPEDIESGRQDKAISSILIEEGLVCQNYTIRELFKDTLMFICQNVKSQTIVELPGFYFLRILISGLPQIENRSRETKQYFFLLQFLLNWYFDAEKYSPFIFKKIFEKGLFLKQIIQKLNSYKTKEKKGSILEDFTLEGYLQIIELVIQNDPLALESDEYFELMQQIVERYLFTFQYDTIKSHITKEVDIQANEAIFINKCQTTESRQSAYNLLLALSKQQPGMIGEMISKYWYPLLQRVKKPKKAGYAPKSEGRSYQGYVGLKNLGSICYMNSMIQQFFHIPAFRYSILSVQDNQDANYQEFDGENVDDNVLHQFMKLIGFLELSDRQDYNPAEFCFSFKDYGGQPVNVRIQQDAQEFLNVIFDKLDNILANTSQKYLLKNIFGGKTCSMMLCKSCGNLKERHEDFYNLSLEVKNQKSVYDGLRKFISGEVINDFQCEACNQRVDVERKTVIEKLPNTLIVHLQRIYFDFDSLQNQKLNTRVEFPNVLNLQPFMRAEALKQNILQKNRKKSSSSYIQSQQNGIIKENNQKNTKEDEKNDETMLQNQQEQEPHQTQDDDEQSFNGEDDIEMKKRVEDEQEDEINFEYKLVGVVVHMGTADAGHYISYININRDQKPSTSADWLKTDNEKWLEFNDSLVKEYKFKGLEEDCFGGASSTINTSTDFKNDYSRNAYMLIYDKRIKEDMRVIIDEGLLQQESLVQFQQTVQPLDCDRTTISRDKNEQIQQNQQLPHLLYAMPDINKVLTNKHQIHYDEERKEYFTLVDTRTVQRFVPNNIYIVEDDDNQTFLIEKQVFNNSFFKCTQQLIEMMLKFSPESLNENSIDDTSCQRLFEFMERLIFDLLSMTAENKQLLDLTKLYLSMLQKNDQQTIRLINKRILNINNELKLAKNEKTFLENLLSNMDKEVREMYQIILTFSVNRLFEIYGDNNELLESIMNNIFGLMPDDCAKNWLKIDQYLTFIYNVTKSGPIQLDYMVKKKVVTRLIDFFLENESPLSTNLRRQQMGSNYANPPFEFLIRTITFIARNMPVLSLLDQPIVNQEVSDEPLNIQQIPDLQLKQRLTSPYFLQTFDNYVVTLSEDDIKMLTLKQLYSKSMKNGYECNEIGRLASHVCFENQKFSKSLSKQILLGINTANGDSIQPYLDVLEPFICINDSIQIQRFEWILGVSYLKLERSTVYNMITNQTNLKTGVGLIDHISNDVFDYKSTLFKTQTAVKDSLLQILYQYRKRWQKYALLILQVLLRAAFNDKTNLIYKYIISLPPPTYAYENYFSWITPYLQETIDNCAKNSNISTYRQDQLLAINIQTQLESLLEQNNLVQGENTQQNELQQDLLRSVQDINKSKIQNSEPYLIWKILEEKQIDQRHFNDGMIQVNTYEMLCEITESAPTGHSNLAIPVQNFMNQNTNQNRQMHSNPYGNNFQNQNRVVPQRYPQNTAQARGQGNINGQPIQTRRAPRIGGGRKKKGKQVIVSKNQNAQFKEEVGNAVTAPIAAPQDTNEEFHASAVGPDMYKQSPQDANYMEIDQDEGDDYEENDDDEATDYTGNNQQEQDDNLAEGQVIEQDQEEKHPSDSGQNNINQGVSGGIVPDVAMDNQQKNERDDYWQAQVITILGFTVRNLDTMRTQKIIVKFLDKSDGNELINFKIPQSEIPCQVLAGKEREIIIFTKLRPFDGWGQYDFDVQVAASNSGLKIQLQSTVSPMKGGPGPTEQANMNMGSGSNQGVAGNMTANNNQDEQPNDIMAPNIAGDVDMTATSDKKCGICTFLNHYMLIRCEMCDAVLN